jgi:hypothetical protein
MVPTGFDPVTLFHWMWWKLRCHEASGEEFQKLFEEVVKRAADDFVPIRPYGNMGDLKSDGLYWGDGVVFQVYAPDEMKQAATKKKIKEDLAGAARHWGGDLKEWVFVYNVRRGLPPDVARILRQEQKKYPDVWIRPLSNDQLWEIIRGLSVQQRSEILGAPTGYEHLLLMPSALPEEIRERLQEGRFVIIQDVMTPINVLDAARAMEPEMAFGPPLFVRPSTTESWEIAAAYQQLLLDEAIERSKDLLPRFAVFSLSPIPLAVHLGYLLSDRAEVRHFQYDRDRKTWSWDPDCAEWDTSFRIAGMPDEAVEESVDVVVRVSLSALIATADTQEAIGACPVEIDLFVEEPDVMWLRHPAQLLALGKVFRRLLSELNRRVPSCRRIHLFYAGPIGGAITLGQAINPRMNPVVDLYEFDRRKTPRYERVLTLS